jgi:hypothetical protein
MTFASCSRSHLFYVHIPCVSSVLSLSPFYPLQLEAMTEWKQNVIQIGPKQTFPCTDKKEKEIFLIYREIQKGSGAKSYMRKGSLIYEEVRKYLVIYEEAVSHIL